MKILLFLMTIIMSFTLHAQNTFNGFGSWSTPSNWSSGSVPSITDSVIISQNSVVQIPQNTTAECKYLEVESDAQVYVDGNITISTNIFNNSQGILRVRKTGSLIQNSNSSNQGTGDYIYERDDWGETLRYSVWSSPVQSAVIHDNGIFSDCNPCDMYRYQQISQNWRYDFPLNYSTSCLGNPVTFTANDITTDGPADGIMDVGIGYYITGNANGTVVNRKLKGGVFNNGDYSISTGNPSAVVGNPYPSTIDITEFIQDNSLALRDGTVYFFDGDDAQYDQSDFVPLNIFTGGEIAAAQGFSVETYANQNIVFENDQRIHDNSATFYKTEANNVTDTKLRLSFYQGLKYSTTIVGLSDNATDTIDYGYDALNWDSANDISLSSYLNSKHYSIGVYSHPLVDSIKEIQLSFNATDTDGVGYFRFENFGNSHSYNIYLKNSLTNTLYEMSEGELYEIDIVNTINNNFLSLLITEKILPTDPYTSIEELKENNLNFINNSDNIILIENEEWKLFDIQGRLIKMGNSSVIPKPVNSNQILILQTPRQRVMIPNVK